MKNNYRKAFCNKQIFLLEMAGFLISRINNGAVLQF